MGCVVWKLITRCCNHHMMPRPLVSSFGSRDAKNDTSPSATTGRGLCWVRRRHKVWLLYLFSLSSLALALSLHYSSSSLPPITISSPFIHIASLYLLSSSSWYPQLIYPDSVYFYHHTPLPFRRQAPAFRIAFFLLICAAASSCIHQGLLTSIHPYVGEFRVRNMDPDVDIMNMNTVNLHRKDTTKGPPLRVLSLGV